mgnify:CR=1 FL=1
MESFSPVTKTFHYGGGGDDAVVIAEVVDLSSCRGRLVLDVVVRCFADVVNTMLCLLRLIITFWCCWRRQWFVCCRRSLYSLACDFSHSFKKPSKRVSMRTLT